LINRKAREIAGLRAETITKQLMTRSENKKGTPVAVGLSGGVDSSVAAALLKEKGYTVRGITMQIFDGSLKLKEGHKHACYGPGEIEDLEAAESVCKKLNIPLDTIDLRVEYRQFVIDHFRSEYLAGKTPNPCIVCNRRLKFGFLIDKAKKIGVDFEFFATGHYARIVKSGRQFLLKKAKDPTKDQSYFLYALTPEQLTHTIFPLGTHLKHQVRDIARAFGLTTADRTESQDFIAGGDYSLFFGKDEIKAGEIIDRYGKILGQHRGIIHYTVGQRRGLGIASSQPFYVVKIDAANNRIVVGDKEDLYSQGLIAKDINLIALDKIERPCQAKVKIRLNSGAVDATVFPYTNGKLKVMFNKPQMSVTPGQHAVFYDKDTVIGGGVIQKALKSSF
jgi:tRNA-specific 2-thiouridylase